MTRSRRSASGTSTCRSHRRACGGRFTTPTAPSRHGKPFHAGQDVVVACPALCLKTRFFATPDMARLLNSETAMIWELLLALSLPIWLFVEQLTVLRRKRRRATIVAARN